MAYNPITGVYTPDPVAAYNPLSSFSGQTTPTSLVTDSTNTGLTPAEIQADAAAQAAADALNAKPSVKTETGRLKNADGTFTVIYSDGTFSIDGSPAPTGISQSAKDIVNQFLTESGMGALSDQVWSQWTAGTSAPQIIDYVRKTPEYALRFPAMASLNKAGRNISEAAYIAKEQADIDLMKQYGIDTSVYGTTSYLGSLIENNVTYSDLNSRLIAVRDTVKSYDPTILKYAKDTYGLTEGDLMGWAIDPTKSLPAIQQKAEAFKIGGAALAAGYNAQSANKELTQEQANALAAAGVTQQQAQQGFTNLGQMGQYQQALPGETNASLTEQQLINAQFGLNAPDIEAFKTAKQKKLSEFAQGGNFAATQAGLTGIGSAPSV